MAAANAHIPPPESNGAPLHKVGTQFAARGHSGGNRVSDYGPGADSATVAGTFGFADLLDVINPLQHVPLLASVYREVTGDRIGAPARILGDVLYGGPVGLAFGAVDVLFAEVGGRSPGDALVAALFGDTETPDSAPALAEAKPDRGVSEPGQAEPLSGEAALQALLADMRPLGQTAAPPEAAPSKAREAQGRAFEIRDRDRHPAALATPTRQAAPLRAPAHSDLASTAALQPSFAQRMMLALDKYEAQARRGDETSPGSLLDRGL